MASKAGYWLIAIGLIWLAFNTGYLNLSMFAQQGILPVSLIIVGVIELFVHFVELGDLGETLKTIAGIALFLIIFINIGYFFSRLFIPSYNWSWSFDSEEVQFNVNGTSINSAFTNLDLNIINNNLVVEYFDKSNTKLSEVIEIQDDKLYEFINTFGDFSFNFADLVAENVNLSVTNSFGTTSLNNLDVYNNARVSSSFGDTNVHTGDITGELVLVLDSSFGTIDIYIDENAAYNIDTSNAFGAVNNYVGLESSDYDTAVNKIHLIVSNSFGAINIYKE